MPHRHLAIARLLLAAALLLGSASAQAQSLHGPFTPWDLLTDTFTGNIAWHARPLAWYERGWNVSFRDLAFDAGQPGHMVGASARGDDAVPELFEASGCDQAQLHCRVRQLAWTTDGRWHYSSLAHLATSADWQAPEACAAALELPLASCPVDPIRVCNGGEPRDNPSPTPREDACLESHMSTCMCRDPYRFDAADREHLRPIPLCRFPAPTSVQIDPRNGWVYATTESGLLVSVDGGRSWGRGPDSPVPALRPEATSAGTLPDGREPGPYPLPPSPVQLWTQDGADLNRTPWRIAAMGKLTLVFEPSGAPGANGRPQGTVAASMTVQWLTERGEPRADVFVARSEQRDGAGPLVFRATGR